MFTYIPPKKSTYTLLVLSVTSLFSVAQSEDSLSTTNIVDTTSTKMNMDAIYDRPFLNFEKAPVSVGGYVEGNSLYQVTDGVSEGLSIQARRLTLFMSGSIAKRIKFLSEMEFEEGGNKIGIEFAAMDVTIHPALNLRGGVIMNPIGAFNQNHDGPKWEFVERPDVSVNLLPATWSNAGFGIYGKTHKNNWTLGYEAYITNGFDGTIIDNIDNKTQLSATKNNPERFEESTNGSPLFTTKLAIKNRKYGEIGLSHMGGVYNQHVIEGVEVDNKRRVDVYAIDLNTTIKKTDTYIVGEIVFLNVDVPETYTQRYGNKQKGAFIDIVQPILKKEILDWEDARLNLALRLDYADWNVGTFNESGTNIGEDVFAITPAISLRPSSQTVFRINYRYQWDTDLLDNPAAKTASWLMGFSTYF